MNDDQRTTINVHCEFKGGAAKPPAFSIWYLVSRAVGFSGCWGKGAKRAKLGGQGGQVRKVAKHLDGSGFGSRRPRGPSCNKGGGGFATEQRKSKVESRAGARAVHCNEQRNAALNEQRATPVRDFKSHRDCAQKTLINDH